MLTACEGGNGGASVAQSTVEIRPTNYVTQPPVTTTSTLPGATIPPGELAGREQTYTVQSGDVLSGIAAEYGVSAQDIADYNDWSDGTRHLIYRGLEIKIPPNARVPDDDDDDDAGGDPLDDLPPPTGGPLCPDGTQRDTYEVRSGDYVGRVADRLDLTIEELEAANEGNPIWSSFMVGEDLWLPCEGEDMDTATDSSDVSEPDG